MGGACEGTGAGAEAGDGCCWIPLEKFRFSSSASNELARGRGVSSSALGSGGRSP